MAQSEGRNKKLLIGIAFIAVLGIYRGYLWFTEPPPPPTTAELKIKVEKAMQKTKAISMAAKEKGKKAVVIDESPKPLNPPASITVAPASVQDIKAQEAVAPMPPPMPVMEPILLRAPLPRRITSLFVYIRIHNLVLRSTVESVEGALKLLNLAEGLWASKKIKIALDWDLKDEKKL
jgi:hypothetical protein